MKKKQFLFFALFFTVPLIMLGILYIPIWKTVSYVKKEYYSTGQLFSETTYKDSLREGQYIQYYKNGEKQFTGSYYKDVLDGDFTGYDSLGNIQCKGYYSRGKPSGGIFCYYKGHLVLYHEMDYSGDTYYAKTYDTTSGKLIKEEGHLLSSNYFYDVYKDTAENDFYVYFTTFYAQPKGDTNDLRGFVNDSAVGILTLPYAHVVMACDVFTNKDKGKYNFKITSVLRSDTSIIVGDTAVIMDTAIIKKDSCMNTYIIE
jgi:hypothetical protein